VVNFLTSMAREPGMSREDILLAVTTISFDIAGLELYLPLSIGARVVIAEREEVSDGFALLLRMQQCEATIMQATPATWRLLLEAGFQPTRGFKMLCGGEALPRELANRLLQGPATLWNMYGPTETTIWSSCSQITLGDTPVTVGGPIANTQFYVLDQHDQPAAAGIPGQLHIGGDGVARGYHKRPELTAERFVNNPFVDGRMYRTGDLAKWLPNGQLQVLGRMDQQVKLRGLRIELGEIESVLLRKAAVAAAAVILREDVSGSPRLVAYYVESGGPSRTPAELRALLGEELPDYMVPTVFVRLAALPSTPNGKLDRQALPAPVAEVNAGASFVAPANPLERTLAQIWESVLGNAPLGRDADIFELGADSIQMFQITARARRAGLSLTAKQVIQHRTIANLAAALAGAEPHAATARAGMQSVREFKKSRASQAPAAPDRKATGGAP
jgi:acyl-coenzyme A synthetase/AMP-(fatty) acid ligase/aryl carrier-like protein